MRGDREGGSERARRRETRLREIKGGIGVAPQGGAFKSPCFSEGPARAVHRYIHQKHEAHLESHKTRAEAEAEAVRLKAAAEVEAMKHASKWRSRRSSPRGAAGGGS